MSKIDKEDTFLDAVENGFLEIAENLLKSGVSVHTLDNLGLLLAVETKNAEMVKLLLDFGANPLAQDGDIINVAKIQRNSKILDLLTDAKYKENCVKSSSRFGYQHNDGN
jgi:ankyrin repeat protein